MVSLGVNELVNQYFLITKQNKQKKQQQQYFQSFFNINP